MVTSQSLLQGHPRDSLIAKKIPTHPVSIFARTSQGYTDTQVETHPVSQYVDTQPPPLLSILSRVEAAGRIVETARHSSIWKEI